MFTVTKHGHTKLFLPKHLVTKLSSSSKVLVDTETEAMKGICEKKLLEQQPKYENQNSKVDQQIIGDDTLKEMRKAGISTDELVSLTKVQQYYEEKQKKGAAKGKGNREMLEHQRRVKVAQEILKLDDTSKIDVSMLDIEKQAELLEEATAHKKINKDFTNAENAVGSVDSKGIPYVY